MNGQKGADADGAFLRLLSSAPLRAVVSFQLSLLFLLVVVAQFLIVL